MPETNLPLFSSKICKILALTIYQLYQAEIYNKDKGVTVEYIYKNEVKKRLYRYDIEYTSEGKYRRNFQNGKYIDYMEDPNYVSVDKATYAFDYDDRIEEKGRSL